MPTQSSQSAIIIVVISDFLKPEAFPFFLNIIFFRNNKTTCDFNLFNNNGQIIFESATRSQHVLHNTHDYRMFEALDGICPELVWSSFVLRTITYCTYVGTFEFATLHL